MQTDRRHFPVWLWYALLCIFWSGLWGFLSKIGSVAASPLQMQILFTLGMLPVAVGMLVQMRGEAGSQPWRNSLRPFEWHCYPAGYSRILFGAARTECFRSHSTHRRVSRAHGVAGIRGVAGALEQSADGGHASGLASIVILST